VKLVVLGSGGSWPCRERNPPAVALKLDGDIILFDCAEGTQRQFMFSTVSFMQVGHILLSHMHGDHFLGLPGLVETMGLNDRRDELHVWGPPGTAKRLRSLFTVGYFSAAFPVVLHDLRGGDEADLGGCRLRCAESSHLSVPSLAYSVEENGRPGRFNLERAKELGLPAGRLFTRLQDGETVTHAGKTFTPDMVLGPPRKGRKVVYTGDTAPSPAMVELARNADVLIHDSTADAALADKANQYGHSSNVQAAETALQAGVRTLLLIHISPRFGQEDSPRILAEAQKVFPGTVLASDLMELEIKLRD
jgi:ribonuclease Z